MNIYFAGKVNKNGWRSDIVNLRSRPVYPNSWPERLKIEGTDHFYTGPFFYGDDHGSCHGDSTHAQASGFFMEFDQKNFDHGPADVSNPTWRAIILENCLDAIKRSDAIFAYFDKSSFNAYGTIAEIGYANSLGKPIYIAVSQDFLDDISERSGRETIFEKSDYWFIAAMAFRVITVDRPREAFDKFFSLYKKPYPLSHLRPLQ